MNNLKIVILGEAKSGTTGLFYKFKNSMPKTTRCVFEPKGYEYLPKFGDDARSVLIKALFGDPNRYRYHTFDKFDKKVFIVRDPRDRIVSEMLFWVCESSFWRDEAKLREFMDLLIKKENNPGSVSLVELIRLGRLLDNPTFKLESWKLRIVRRLELMREFLANNPGYFVLKYEVFVSGQLAELENYLGFSLKGKSDVTGFEDIVTRTKSYGDWKNWFTEKDIDFFRPYLESPLKQYGFSSDWSVNRNQVIQKDHGSGYVIKTLLKKGCDTNLL